MKTKNKISKKEIAELRYFENLIEKGKTKGLPNLCLDFWNEKIRYYSEGIRNEYPSEIFTIETFLFS
jgi:hypothetical protein